VLKTIIGSLRNGRDAYIAGLMQITHGSSAVPKPLVAAHGSAVMGYYGWNHILFEQQSNGSWIKDNIIIVADGGTTSSYTVTIDWNKEAVQDFGDKYIVCHVPNLPALTGLLRLLYPHKVAKFTSLVDEVGPKH